LSVLSGGSISALSSLSFLCSAFLELARSFVIFTFTRPGPFVGSARRTERFTFRGRRRDTWGVLAPGDEPTEDDCVSDNGPPVDDLPDSIGGDDEGDCAKLPQAGAVTADVSRGEAEAPAEPSALSEIPEVSPNLQKETLASTDDQCPEVHSNAGQAREDSVKLQEQIEMIDQQLRELEA
jgi:hypothetical protein